MNFKTESFNLSEPRHFLTENRSMETKTKSYGSFIDIDEQILETMKEMIAIAEAGMEECKLGKRSPSLVTIKNVPTRDEFIQERLDSVIIQSDLHWQQVGRDAGEYWDLRYGPNRDPVVVRRLERERGVPLTGVQRVQDYREKLGTKQRRWPAEARRKMVLANIKKKDRLYREEKRANETLDQERERQKADRLRHQKNRDLAKQNAGIEPKPRLTPEEQKIARKAAQAAYAQAKRAKEKAEKGAGAVKKQLSAE